MHEDSAGLRWRVNTSPQTLGHKPAHPSSAVGLL